MQAKRARAGGYGSHIAGMTISAGVFVLGILILAGILPSDDLVTRILCGLLALLFGLLNLVGMIGELAGVLPPYQQEGRVERIARRGPFWCGVAEDGGQFGFGFGIGYTPDLLDVSDEDGPGIEIR